MKHWLVAGLTIPVFVAITQAWAVWGQEAVQPGLPMQQGHVNPTVPTPGPQPPPAPPSEEERQRILERVNRPTPIPDAPEGILPPPVPVVAPGSGAAPRSPTESPEEAPR